MNANSINTVEMTEEVYAKYAAGEVTLEEAKAMSLYLKKLEYRQVYNARPEVKAKRKAYMRARNNEAKIGRQLLNGLLKK